MNTASLSKKKIGFQLAIAFFITLSLSVGVYLNQRAQSLRTSADPGNAVLSVIPSSQSNNLGESGTVNLFLNPNGEAVAGVQLVMNFDPSVLKVTGISAAEFFTDLTDADPSFGPPLVLVNFVCNDPSPCTFGSTTLPSGQLYYAVAFPLGSQFSSTAAKNAVDISYTTVGSGTSPVSFVESGQPLTVITDINAQNVIAYSANTNGTVNVASGGGARLYFSSPTPSNPQTVGNNFTVSILADTGGQDADGIDARIQFDTGFLQAVNVVQGSDPAFTSYPALDFDNARGTISVSANTGTGVTATPANGDILNIGTITFSPSSATPTYTSISYDFTPGDRNDSNIVLSGTSQTGDPVDILTNVANAIIQIQELTITPTPGPSAPTCSVTGPTQLNAGATGTYTATASDPDGNLSLTKIYSTPQSYESWTLLYSGSDGGTATLTCPDSTSSYYIVCNASDTTGLNCTGNPFAITPGWSDCGDNDAVSVACLGAGPTATPTPPPQIETLILRLKFQGRTRTGADNSKAVAIDMKSTSGETFPTVSLTTDFNGEAPLSISPGSYIILIKAPGYLAKSYGTSQNPIVITSGQTLLDLSSSPLIAGDFNEDGVVNEVDYTTGFLGSFQSDNPTVDIDGSGEVNNLDFGPMRSNWNLVDDSL